MKSIYVLKIACTEHFSVAKAKTRCVLPTTELHMRKNDVSVYKREISLFICNNTGDEEGKCTGDPRHLQSC